VLCAGLLCASSASAAPARAKSIALLGITGGAGSDARTIGSLEEVVLAALAASRRFERVVGRSDIASVLGWEGTRQKLGCEESIACIAEVAGALGVDFIAAADLGRFGTTTVLTFKLVDARSGRALSRVLRKVASDADLPDAVPPVVAEALEVLPAAPGRAARPWRLPMWAGVGAAVVAAGAGAFFASASAGGASRTAGAPTQAAVDAARADAERGALGASVSFAAAGVAAAGAAVFWWLGRDASPEP